MTKQNGVDVWSNAAIWMWDELKSKVRSLQSRVESYANSCGFQYPVESILAISSTACHTVLTADRRGETIGGYWGVL